MIVTRIALAPLLLLGCTPAPSSAPAPVAGTISPAPPASAPAPAPPQLAGSSFRIVSVDGRAPEMVMEDAGKPRTPRFQFARRSYGGTSGCNFMGGLYARVGERLYTMPGPQTAMGCGGRLGEQERAIAALFAASPTLTADDSGIVLHGAGHRMTLAREPEASPPQDAPVAWQGESLTGESFIVWAVNGIRSAPRAGASWPSARLEFAGGVLTAEVDCPQPLTARYRQEGDRLSIDGVSTPCTAAGARDGALAAILADDPRLVSGPNGELLLASRSGWATAENERRDRPK